VRHNALTAAIKKDQVLLAVASAVPAVASAAAAASTADKKKAQCSKVQIRKPLAPCDQSIHQQHISTR
jgi:hypothetical protein